MAKKPLAVVTMVYNEPDFLPIWWSYYSQQVGGENCFIVDHGSDDGSTAPFKEKCSVIGLPRSPHSDADRAQLISRLAASLLVSFEKVLYSDVDEFVVADPRHYRSLEHYAHEMPYPVVTAIGMDVIPVESEPALAEGPILSQRRWVRPFGFLCKPVITSREISWWSGFHGYSGPAEFDRVYLFHLASMDLELVRKRQIKKNKSAPIDGGGAHHRVSPTEAVQHVRNIADAQLRATDVDFDLGSRIREDFIEDLFRHEHPTDQIKNFHIDRRLWEIPARFRQCV